MGRKINVTCDLVSLTPVDAPAMAARGLAFAFRMGTKARVSCAVKRQLTRMIDSTSAVL